MLASNSHYRVRGFASLPDHTSGHTLHIVRGIAALHKIMAIKVRHVHHVHNVMIVDCVRCARFKLARFRLTRFKRAWNKSALVLPRPSGLRACYRCGRQYKLQVPLSCL